MFLKKDENVRNNNKLAEAKMVYDEFVEKDKELPTEVMEKRRDFVVYCDLGRFKETGDGRYEDTENEATVDASISPFTLAFTEDPKYCGDTAPSQLQICSWFLDWMKNRDEGVAPKKGHRASTLENVVIPILRNKMAGGLLSEIDSRSLFDKVLLHEMTHTRGAGKSEDVGDKNGFFSRLRNVKYGWKRCRELAEKDPADRSQKSYKNADSLALAASAIRFNNEGQIVQKDGKIKPAEEC